MEATIEVNGLRKRFGAVLALDGMVWMRGLLRSLAAQGRSVLVSSHLMSELQDAADHLVVAGRGRVIADASVAGLIAAASVSGHRATLEEAYLRITRDAAEFRATGVAR